MFIKIPKKNQMDKIEITPQMNAQEILDIVKEELDRKYKVVRRFRKKDE